MFIFRTLYVLKIYWYFFYTCMWTSFVNCFFIVNQEKRNIKKNPRNSGFFPWQPKWVSRFEHAPPTQLFCGSLCCWFAVLWPHSRSQLGVYGRLFTMPLGATRVARAQLRTHADITRSRSCLIGHVSRCILCSWVAMHQHYITWHALDGWLC